MKLYFYAAIYVLYRYYRAGHSRSAYQLNLECRTGTHICQRQLSFQNDPCPWTRNRACRRHRRLWNSPECSDSRCRRWSLRCHENCNLLYSFSNWTLRLNYSITLVLLCILDISYFLLLDLRIVDLVKLIIEFLLFVLFSMAK